MHKHLKSLFQFVVFLSIGVFLIYLFSRNITSDQWTEMKNALRNIHYQWIALSIVFALLSHLSRSIRWQQLLEPLSHKPKLKNTFLAIMVGYFFNLAVPRLGEITRCGLIHKYENIEFQKTIGTVFLDRLVDVLTLLLLFAIAMVWQYDLVGNLANEKVLQPLMVKLSGLIDQPIFLILLFTIIALIYIIWRKLKHKVSDRVHHVLKDLKEGFSAITKIENKAMFVFHSIFIWVMYFMMIYVCFQATDFTSHLGAAPALAVLVFGTFGIIATPGGIGAYPALVALILVLYGIQSHLGYAFGNLIWIMQTALILITGIFSLILMPIVNKNEYTRED